MYPIQVSRRWHALCYDGQLWQNFDATEFYKDIPVDKLAEIIVKSGSFIRHLNLRLVQISFFFCFRFFVVMGSNI